MVYNFVPVVISCTTTICCSHVNEDKMNSNSCLLYTGLHSRQPISCLTSSSSCCGQPALAVPFSRSFTTETPSFIIRGFCSQFDFVHVRGDLIVSPDVLPLFWGFNASLHGGAWTMRESYLRSTSLFPHRATTTSSLWFT